MENKIKLSIIVPVYNTGEYLRGCIDSVLAQTLTEWELILIDDGSTDNSGAICDEYADKDSRIRVIHKQNQGVSVARNVGLGLANGEFIGFIDSDDTVKFEMFKTMYNKALETGSNIVMCDAVTVYSDCREEPDTITQLAGSCIIEKRDFTPELLMEMAGSTCRCIYSSALIQRHSLQFPVALKFSEDRIFNIYNFGFANKIYYIKEPFYNRLIWEGSAVHRFHSDYFEMAKKADEGTAKALEIAWSGDEEYKKSYKSHFITSSIGAINNYFYKTSPLSFKEKYKAVKMICEDAQLKLAISACAYNDIRVSFIKKKMVLPLCFIAMILNKKYNR